MKKHAVALFAGLLILAIAAPLFAETYLDGMVYYRARIFTNSDLLKGNPNTDLAHILPILYLGAGYKAEDYAEAYFRLYTLGAGYSLGGSSYAGAAPVNMNRDVHGVVKDTDTPGHHDVSLTQAWFDVKIPGTPVHWRLGRFAQSLGHGFYYNTGAYGGDGMKFWTPIGPVRLDLGYTKMNEKFDFANDIDQYFLQVAAPIDEKHQISAAIQWFEGRNMALADDDEYPGDKKRWKKNVSSRPGDINHIFTVWNNQIKFDSRIWTIGVAADGAVPMDAMSITYRAEAVYAGGNLTDDFSLTEEGADELLLGTTTVKFKEEEISGFALLAGASLNLGPATVSLEGAWGSGDKKSKLSKANLGSGTKYEGFKVPMAQWGRTVWFDEWSFFDGTATGDPFDFGGTFGGGKSDKKGTRSGGWHQRGLENLIYLTVGATYTPITPVTLGLDIFKFWADQTVPKGGFDPDGRLIWSKKQDSDIGWEVDLTAKWTFNKNFSLVGAFAPFFPGDYFKVPKNSIYLDKAGGYEYIVLNDAASIAPKVVEKTSDPEWGYVLRANCIFTF